MIQEKDFLYRVPVKNVLVTTPRQQVRNPEILVDVEGGEFMHGNILDANSTNKLINQSVKDAVDNKLIESGYLTKDLLDAETTRATEQENSLKTLIGAETSARTKGDEDLSSKIKAEQTRAEGKEKEISDKLAIVNGDSNTEGSFRKAIADVVAAAPEDLDTLKEIADKLAGNDDLHTALNQAITEKADASALLNEVTRATGAESGLQAAIATKADATALSNYVLTTALNQQVDTLNAAISAKQDAGNYMKYDSKDDQGYTVGWKIAIGGGNVYTDIAYNGIIVQGVDKNCILDDESFQVNGNGGRTTYTINGIKSYEHNNCLATSDGTFKPISDFVLKTELPTVPTKTSQLTNDSNFITAADVDFTPYATTQALTAVEQKVTANTTAIEDKQDAGYYVTYIRDDGSKYTLQKGFEFSGGTGNVAIDESGVDINIAGSSIILNNMGIAGSEDNSYYQIDCNNIKLFNMDTEIRISPIEISSVDDEDTTLFNIGSTAIILGPTNNPNVKISEEGITFKGKTNSYIPTAGGTFVELSSLASAEDISSLRTGLSKKQGKITVNEVDITDIETADITKLRTIVTNLINALSASDLIRETQTLE